MRKIDQTRALVAAVAAAPTAVFAHAGAGDSHDLLHGFMHPIGGADHVLAMIAVGMVAAQLGGRALWAVPLSFIATMAIAAALGIAGLALPGVEVGIALSVIVVGAVVSLRVRLPVILATTMVAVFAVFHGYAHGVEMGNVRSGIEFGFGFVLATALLHLTGIGLGATLLRTRSLRGQRLAQASGGALALAGVVLLAAA